MVIKVAAKHIRDGRRGAPGYCPIALALKERLHKRVSVGRANVLCFTRKKSSMYFKVKTAELPKEAIDFVSDFDLVNKVKPFTFEVIFTTPEFQT